MINTFNIPTEEILKDIVDTAKEIKKLQEDNARLYQDPQANKMSIYVNKGRITSREQFLDRLRKILFERREAIQ